MRTSGCIALALVPLLAPMSASAQAPSQEVLVEGNESGEQLAVLGRNPLRCAFNGRRAERRGATWVEATDRLHRLAVAREVAGRWLFVGSTGAVAVSNTFLGPLSMLMEQRVVDTIIPWTPSSVALLGVDRSLWETNGVTVRRLLDSRWPVRAARVDGSGLALVVLQDGRLFRLEADGSPRQVALEGELALSLHAQGHQVVVLTSRRAFTLMPDGTQQDVPTPSPHEAEDVSACAAYGAYRQSRAALRTLRSAPMPDGGRVDVDGFNLVRYAADGRVRGRYLDRCRTVEPWGQGVFARCDQAYHSLDGERFEVFPPPAATNMPMDHIQLGWDGDRLAFVGRCTSGPHGRPSICIFDRRTRAWAQVEVPAGVSPIAGPAMIGGERCLIMASGEGRVEWVVVSLRGGGLWRVTTVGGQDGDRLEYVHLTPDGGVVAEVQRRDASGNLDRRVAIGPVGSPLPTRALPPNASAFDFADLRRGMAVGRTLRDLWRTLDGGVTWQRLPTSLVGDRNLVLWSPHGLTCDAAGCRNAWFSVRGWGPVRPPAERLLLPNVEDLAVEEPLTARPLSCREVTPPTRLPPLSPALTWSMTGGAVVGVGNDRLPLEPTGDEQEWVEPSVIAWRHAGGPLRRTAPPDGVHDLHVERLQVSRSGVFWRSDEADDVPTLWLSMNRERALPEVAPTRPEERHLFSSRSPVEVAERALIVESQDSVVVLAPVMRSAPDMVHPGFARGTSGVFVFGLDGRQRQARLTLERGDGISLREGRWGVATLRGSDRFELRAVASPPEEVSLAPWAAPRAITPCTGPRSPQATRVFLRTGTLESGTIVVHLNRDYAFGHVELEIERGTVCVRGFEGQMDWAPADCEGCEMRRVVVSLHAEGGALLGPADTLEARMRLRCDLIPPAE